MIFESIDLGGESPLQLACFYRQLDVIQLILDRGAKFENDLIHSVKFSPGDVSIGFLIQHRADINTLDRFGNSWLYNLCKENCFFETGNAFRVEFFLAKGADPNILNSSEISPLHEACKNCNFNICKLLIDAGAQFDDKNLIDKCGKNLLYFAVSFGRLDIIEFLISKGIDLNFVYDLHITMLSIAAKKGHLKLVNVLIH